MHRESMEFVCILGWFQLKHADQLEHANQLKHAHIQIGAGGLHLRLLGNTTLRPHACAKITPQITTYSEHDSTLVCYYNYLLNYNATLYLGILP